MSLKQSHRTISLLGTAVTATALLAACSSKDDNHIDVTPVIPTTAQLQIVREEAVKQLALRNQEIEQELAALKAESTDGQGRMSWNPDENILTIYQTPARAELITPELHDDMDLNGAFNRVVNRPLPRRNIDDATLREGVASELSQRFWLRGGVFTGEDENHAAVNFFSGRVCVISSAVPKDCFSFKDLDKGTPLGKDLQFAAKKLGYKYE